MTRRPISTEAPTAQEIEATTRCFERYGADPARWPAPEREAYGAFADADALAAARAEAVALDGFLGAATAPRMEADLPLKVMAAFDAHQAQGAGSSVPGGWRASGFGAVLSVLSAGPRLAFAGAFAAAAALGVVSGLVSAAGGGGIAPETEAYAYLMDASPFLFDDAEVSR